MSPKKQIHTQTPTRIVSGAGLANREAVRGGPGALRRLQRAGGDGLNHRHGEQQGGGFRAAGSSLGGETGRRVWLGSGQLRLKQSWFGVVILKKSHHSNSIHLVI